MPRRSPAPPLRLPQVSPPVQVRQSRSLLGSPHGIMKLLESVDCFNNAVLAKLQSIFKDLERRLNEHSRIAEAVHAIFWQQMEATRAKLINFTLDLVRYITHRQREISRLLTPEIKGRMEPAYAACSHMSGHGYFQLMKEKMESYTQREKEAIFDAAIEKLLEQLCQLQQRIQERFQSLVWELTRSLKMQFEPILKPVQKNRKIIPELMTICAKVDKLCRRSCVDYILPCTALAADGSPGMEGEMVGTQDPMNFGATYMDIHTGSATLPNHTAIQPSVSSASDQEVEIPAVPASLHLLKATTATQQWPHRPPVPLHPGGKKRAGEILQPQLEKKHKGQGTVPGTGGDLTGHPLLHYSGMTEVKLEPDAQDAVSPSPPTTSQAPAPEDCRQKANVIPGSSQTHVPMKVDGFAIPGSSASLAGVPFKEHLYRFNLSLERVTVHHLGLAQAGPGERRLRSVAIRPLCKVGEGNPKSIRNPIFLLYPPSEILVTRIQTLEATSNLGRALFSIAEAYAIIADLLGPLNPETSIKRMLWATKSYYPSARLRMSPTDRKRLPGSSSDGLGPVEQRDGWMDGWMDG
ncbi:hypothetical protein JD844_015351 [Phrynosoma platyrhinos]|uniref:Uncharacterized protein n=1 Tax=Phrynosoma platyrhinos TaxID=52577 RepID=A0ABQ7SJ14_PHRPL|nr:hypothetical protein JD844_015351 [Phrynosoma platyrhinos]